jgi:ubiquitin-protein ligase
LTDYAKLLGAILLGFRAMFCASSTAIRVLYESGCFSLLTSVLQSIVIASEERWYVWHCYIAIPNAITADGIALTSASVPQSSPWAGSQVCVRVSIPRAYPREMPRCRLPKSTLHPNVYPTGAIELSTLPAPWTPQQGLLALLRLVQERLGKPSLLYAIQPNAYTLLNNDPRRYEEEVRRQCASLPLPPLPDLDKELQAGTVLRIP